MAKNTTAKKSAKTTSARTFKRANAICRDRKRYDEETRDAITRAIDENSPNLTELVRRAESGETILDITNTVTTEQSNPKQRQVREIERLALQAVGYDNLEQSRAILQLLTALEPHDGSGLAMRARRAVIRASNELCDEAADCLAKEAA